MCAIENKGTLIRYDGRHLPSLLLSLHHDASDVPGSDIVAKDLALLCSLRL